MSQPPKKRGRPSGKRSNPAYEQTTIYLPRILHAEIKVALIRTGEQDFSELVEELLVAWLTTHRAAPGHPHGSA